MRVLGLLSLVLGAAAVRAPPAAPTPLEGASRHLMAGASSQEARLLAEFQAVKARQLADEQAQDEQDALASYQKMSLDGEGPDMDLPTKPELPSVSLRADSYSDEARALASFKVQKEAQAAAEEAQAEADALEYYKEMGTENPLLDNDFATGSIEDSDSAPFKRLRAEHEEVESDKADEKDFEGSRLRVRSLTASEQSMLAQFELEKAQQAADEDAQNAADAKAYYDSMVDGRVPGHPGSPTD